MPLFELAGADQPTAIEVGDQDGRPVLRLRRGAQVDEHLVGELNDLTGEPGQDETVVARRPPVVVVVVNGN